MEELRDPWSFRSSDGAAPLLRHNFYLESILDMTASEPFTPRTPDPDKAPRLPTHNQPPAEKPGKPLLVPSKSKAAFRWPPDCLWPFTERIGNYEWDGDA